MARPGIRARVRARLIRRVRGTPGAHRLMPGTGLKSGRTEVDAAAGCRTGRTNEQMCRPVAGLEKKEGGSCESRP